DASWNPHRRRSLCGVLSTASARGAGSGDELAPAASLIARARDREESLRESKLPRATAGGASPRRAAFRARPTARLAALRLGNLDRHLRTEGGFFQGDLAVIAKVGPPAPPPRPPSTAH